MGKFDGVLLVSDFDDTLYGYDLRVSEENHRAIAYFMAEGGRFTIATGRARLTFTPQIEKEHLVMNAPAVLSNGAAIYDFEAGRYLRETYLPLEAARDLGEVADAFPQIGLECYHGEDIYIVHPNDYTAHHMVRVGTPWREAGRPEDIPSPFVKVILEGSHEALLEVQKFVLARWGDRYEAIFSNKLLLELTALGSTKGGMVVWLRDRLGVKEEDLYCVGDSSNDLSMLQAAHVGYAPENCTPDLRAWGAVILPDCDHHTLAALIGDLDRRYP